MLLWVKIITRIFFYGFLQRSAKRMNQCAQENKLQFALQNILYEILNRFKGLPPYGWITKGK